MQKQQEVKQMLVKSCVYKQMCDVKKKQMVSTKQRIAESLKKLLKASYFVLKKKWALQENFTDIVDFIKDLGNKDIVSDLKESSCHTTCISKTSAEEFVQCISDYLEEVFKNCLLTALHHSSV